MLSRVQTSTKLTLKKPFKFPKLAHPLDFLGCTYWICANVNRTPCSFMHAQMWPLPYKHLNLGAECYFH